MVAIELLLVKELSEEQALSIQPLLKKYLGNVTCLVDKKEVASDTGHITSLFFVGDKRVVKLKTTLLRCLSRNVTASLSDQESDKEGSPVF